MSIKIKFTQEQLTQMKELYLSGLSTVQVAEKLELDKGVCRRAIQSQIQLRTVQETRRITMGVKFVRSNAFDILTPEAMYWIGFLYADGYIEKNAPVIGVTLSETDRGHVQKFNEFLGGQLKVNDITQSLTRSLKGANVDSVSKMCRVKVADTQLYNRLISLGFTSNKTHVIVPHDLVKYSRDFYRGLVDGDGWVTFVKTKGDGHWVEGAKEYVYPRLGLCGNETTITSFLEFIKLSGIECKSGLKKAPRENALYSMDVTSKPAIQVMNLLYKDATVYLDRKYKKYLECISLSSNFETQKEPYAS